MPFGLVQLSPHTGNFDWAYHSGYQFADTTLRGFAHTHLSGGGVPALGDVLMLPFATDESLDDSAVRFSKSRERASPGYYGTYLPDSGIEVELTATARTGVHRYTFDSAGSYHVLINIDEVLFAWGDPDESKVQEAYFVIENDTTVSGYLRPYVKRVERPVYFTIRLSKPFAASRYLDEPDNRELLLDYTMEAADQLEARVALSTVSIDGAKKNLAAESADRPFESIRADAAQRWNTYLSRARIEGTPAQKAQFYTSLYHLFIQPNNLADVDGRYSGADDEVHRVPSDEMYSTFAFWDTYRAAHPLYTLLIPEKVEPFITSVLRHADEVGYLPVWPLWGRDSKTMIGNHSVPVIVDAYLKGLVDADPDKAFEAIKTTLTRNSWEKYDWSLYDRYGYLPSDTVTFEAVSRTLEATYDDWSAAQMARMLGRHEDAAFFRHGGFAPWAIEEALARNLEEGVDFVGPLDYEDTLRDVYDALGAVIIEPDQAARDQALPDEAVLDARLEYGFKHAILVVEEPGADIVEQVEQTIEDDTLPDGPIQRTITYKAPFVKCDRVEDYRTAWAEFERRLL